MIVFGHVPVDASFCRCSVGIGEDSLRTLATELDTLSVACIGAHVAALMNQARSFNLARQREAMDMAEVVYRRLLTLPYPPEVETPSSDCLNNHKVDVIDTARAAALITIKEMAKYIPRGDYDPKARAISIAELALNQDRGGQSLLAAITIVMEHLNSALITKDARASVLLALKRLSQRDAVIYPAEAINHAKLTYSLLSASELPPAPPMPPSPPSLPTPPSTVPTTSVWPTLLVTVLAVGAVGVVGLLLTKR